MSAKRKPLNLTVINEELNALKWEPPLRSIRAAVKWRGIVKVQRQLNAPRDASALITNKSGSIYYIAEMHPTLLAMFGSDLKFYARAVLRGTIINVQARVSDKDW